MTNELIDGFRQIVFHAYDPDLSPHAHDSAARILAWLQVNNLLRTTYSAPPVRRRA
jgi:hypothetical protein